MINIKSRTHTNANRKRGRPVWRVTADCFFEANMEYSSVSHLFIVFAVPDQPVRNTENVGFIDTVYYVFYALARK